MKNTWIVLVEYGQNRCASLEWLLNTLLNDHSYKLVRVRTDLLPGKFLEDPNEALEFSGYQEGMARALQDISSVAASNISGNPEQFKIVFVNDTVTTGHVTALSYVLLDGLLLMNLQAGSAPIFVGLKMPVFDGSVSTVSGSGEYVTTWAFALIAPLETLRRVLFYNDNEVLPCFESQVFSTLPAKYRSQIKRWLEPEGLFRGWYKSVPGLPLTEATWRRKTLTIYLEHTLPERLSGLGFQMMDLGDRIPFFASQRLRLLRTMDRIFVNIVKLRFRLPIILGGCDR